METYKLTQSAGRVQDLLNTVEVSSPVSYTEIVGLSQWSDSERAISAILQSIHDDNTKIESVCKSFREAIENTTLTEDELKSAVEAYFEENPIDTVTNEELRAAIEAYFIDNPVDVVTDDEIESAVEAYMDDHPITATGGGQLPLSYYADMFTTSKKIQKYENEDTSLDYFVRAEGSSICWYYGEYNGGTETLPDIYWIDASHSALTASPTEYPVTVYTYTEHIRMQVEVAEDETHGPKWTFGAGGGYDNPDYGRSFLAKNDSTTELYQLSDTGEKIGLSMSNNYTDITGLRKITNIDFTTTGFDVRMDGGKVMQYTYTIDDVGNITKITDACGHVTNITYPEVD